MKFEISTIYNLSLLFIFSIFFILLRRKIINKCIKQLIDKKNPKFQKAQSCLFKILFYGIMSCYGYFVLNTEVWTKDLSQYLSKYPNMKYPLKISVYYILEFTYYFTELYFLVDEYTYKDRNELIFHHFITLFLLAISYLNNYTKIGIVVMALHDISDPFLECAKFSIYQNREIHANILFPIFTIVFISTRIFLYPYVILNPLIQYILYEEYDLFACVCLVLLVLLYMLHYFWTVMIYKTIKKIVTNKEIQDARSTSVISTRE